MYQSEWIDSGWNNSQINSHISHSFTCAGLMSRHSKEHDKKSQKSEEHKESLRCCFVFFSGTCQLIRKHTEAQNQQIGKFSKRSRSWKNVGCEYFVQINILAATIWTSCNLYKAPSVKFVAQNYKDWSNLKPNHGFASVHLFTLTHPDLNYWEWDTWKRIHINT